MKFVKPTMTAVFLLFGVMMPFSAANAADGELKQHVLGAFGGFTDAEGETNFSFGFEYEYRFNKTFGAGFLIEHTPGAHHDDGATIYMGQVHLHPWQELRLSVGYGKEDIHHEGTHSENVWRFGVAYDFHTKYFGIAPSFSIDRINGHSTKVFGVALTKAF